MVSALVEWCVLKRHRVLGSEFWLLLLLEENAAIPERLRLALIGNARPVSRSAHFGLFGECRGGASCLWGKQGVWVISTSAGWHNTG